MLRKKANTRSRMARSEGVAGAIKAIRRLLEKIQKDHPDEAKTVEEVARQLAVIEAAVLDPAARSLRRSGEQTRYAVEKVNQRLMLAEFRATGRPLRASRELFDAVVE